MWNIDDNPIYDQSTPQEHATSVPTAAIIDATPYAVPMAQPVSVPQASKLASSWENSLHNVHRRQDNRPQS